MRKSDLDRVTFDGGRLDEVVTHGGMLHIEALDAHNFMIMWIDDDGERIHLHGSNLYLVDHEQSATNAIPETFGPPLTYCGATWRHSGQMHTCTRNKCHLDGPTGTTWPGRHICDCGSSRLNAHTVSQTGGAA